MALEPAILLQHIDEAFRAMEYPGDENIVMDNSASDLESQKIKGLLKGHHWRDLPFEVMDQLRTALPFLTPAAYRFFLPAFMAYSVTDFDRADLIPFELVQTLTLPEASDLERIREGAKMHPEVQPFSAAEWEGILKMLGEYQASGQAKSVFFARVTGFDAAQCEAVHDFLEYMNTVFSADFPNREPERALERYWSRLRNEG